MKVEILHCFNRKKYLHQTTIKQPNKIIFKLLYVKLLQRFIVVHKVIFVLEDLISL